MKRALAERAKQSAGQLPGGPLRVVEATGGSADMSSNDVLSHPVVTTAAHEGRPLKIPRREIEGVVANAAEPTRSLEANGTSSRMPGVTNNAHNAITTTSTTSTTNAASTMKRPRSAASPNNDKVGGGNSNSQPKPHYASDDVTEESQSNMSSFYLKHQNQALASELKALRYQMSLLERERNYRRKQCRIAGQALNSLQATWSQMEVGLQQPLPNNRPAAAVPADAPMSTGSGADVELIGALFDALATLAAKPAQDSSAAPNGDLDDSAQQQQLDDLANVSTNVLQRASTLEQWIWSMLQRLTGTKDEQEGEAPASASLEHRQLTKEVGELRGQVREHQAQVLELTKAREDLAQSERKVRRSIYRLSTGRVNIEQVMKEIEKSDEDGTLAAEARMEALSSPAQPDAAAVQSSSTAGGGGESDTKVKVEPVDAVSNAELTSIRNQLADLEQQLANRDKSIQELQTKLTAKEQRITELCAKEISDEDARKVEMYQKSQKQLEQAEKEIAELKEKLKEAREAWSKAMGDAELATKSANELQKKQKKRWAELTGATSEEEPAEDAAAAEGIDLPLNIEVTEQARKIAELEHKLKQALENVRQADTVRQSLKEALIMNNTLTTKLDEVKSKYAALQASRSNSSSASKAAAAAAAAAANDNQASSSSRDKESRSSSDRIDPSKAEKLHREHRRMRKELAALTASKDAAKSKLERAEKEREMLTETNARLLKQSTEKDDMNARSLSTILHLKTLTEQLTQEKISLELQLKGASQLALAARLATNAKDRLAEEVVKEKEAVETKLEDYEKKNGTLKKELQSTIDEWSEADAKISILNSKLDKATKRSDELVAESEKDHEERRRLQDSLDKALRQAGDATEKMNEISKRVGGGESAGASTFTVDQLNTQVSVLKGRLACPVCHFRDKNCIISRCRHMFCKHCVDENIQNRSRKCPSCGLKFSEKDVEDVWL